MEGKGVGTAERRLIPESAPTESPPAAPRGPWSAVLPSAPRIFTYSSNIAEPATPKNDKATFYAENFNKNIHVPSGIFELVQNPYKLRDPTFKNSASYQLTITLPLLLLSLSLLYIYTILLPLTYHYPLSLGGAVPLIPLFLPLPRAHYQLSAGSFSPLYTPYSSVPLFYSYPAYPHSPAHFLTLNY